MKLKVLILCIGFSGLLYSATGSSEDAPNSNSVNSVAEHPDDYASRQQRKLPELETKQSAAQRDVSSNPTDASSPLQLTTDGRIGELQLSEDNGRSVDVIWQIPNFLKLPYRNDAGIISPDFDSLGFKGFFVIDPEGSMNTSGMMSINSLIIPKDVHSSTQLQVFLKAKDGTLKTYVASVSIRNYFTSNIPKRDIIGNKESMAPGGVLTVVFKLTLDGRKNTNPEVTPSLASAYHVGDLHGRPISSSKFAVTWVFPDFFSLPEYRQLTGSLLRISPDFFFHLYLTPKGRFDEAGFTRLQLSWRYTGDVPPERKVPYPKFSCKFSLKNREDTLYNITHEKYHVALYRGFCYCLVPWSDIYERKDVLVPGGELTLMLNFELESKDVEPETQTARSSPESEEEEWIKVPYATETAETPTTSQRYDMDGRIGDLEISSDTQTGVDITWTINDYFTLPYKPGSGILSPDFSSLGFKGFFVLDPKGSATTPGDLQFRRVIFRHDVPRGKIYFKLFLKMINGTFAEFPVTVPFDNYFTSDIWKLKIVEGKESLAPGGVLTVLFRLSTTGNFADNFKRECDCKSEKKEPECDSRILIPFLKMSSDFLELYNTGAHSDATLMCGDKKFAVHKSILTVRSSGFADMFKRGANGNGIDQNIHEMEDVFTLTDIDCAILDILLRYIYSARVDDIASHQKQQLFEAAGKYGVE